MPSKGPDLPYRARMTCREYRDRRDRGNAGVGVIGHDSPPDGRRCALGLCLWGVCVQHERGACGKVPGVWYDFSYGPSTAGISGNAYRGRFAAFRVGTGWKHIAF